MRDLLIEKALERIRNGQAQDEILKFLSQNCNILDGSVVVRAVYKIPLAEAINTVRLSDYWLDEHECFDACQDAVEEMLELCKFGNSINVISPYKYSGMWVFDDEKLGLLQEPFVGGADTMIDKMTENIPNASEGFALIFSDEEFPGADICLEWRRADRSGNWYYSSLLDMEGWLCPALLKYFAEAPKNIFAKIKGG